LMMLTIQNKKKLGIQSNCPDRPNFYPGSSYPSKLLLTFPFIQSILSFLNYELSINDKSNMEHLRLKISRQLALNLLKDSSNWLNILYKLTNILVQQWQHLHQLILHYI
jgi:hypothetical protein